MEQKSETQPDQQTIDEVLNLFKSGKLNKAKIKIENCIKKFPKSFVLHFSKTPLEALDVLPSLDGAGETAETHCSIWLRFLA